MTPCKPRSCVKKSWVHDILVQSRILCKHCFLVLSQISCNLRLLSKKLLLSWHHCAISGYCAITDLVQSQILCKKNVFRTFLCRSQITFLNSACSLQASSPRTAALPVWLQHPEASFFLRTLTDKTIALDRFKDQFWPGRECSRGKLLTNGSAFSHLIK